MPRPLYLQLVSRGEARIIYNKEQKKKREVVLCTVLDCGLSISEPFCLVAT